MSAPTTSFSAAGAGDITTTLEANGLYQDVSGKVANPRAKLAVADAGTGATLVVRGRLRGLTTFVYVPGRSLKTGLPVDASGFTIAANEGYEFDVTGCDRFEVYASALASGTVSLEARVEPAAPGASPIVAAAAANNATFSAGLTLNGTTGNNAVSVPDNLADAFSIVEGANGYITITTTNSGEAIKLKKNVVLTDAVTITNSANSTGTSLWGASDKGGFFGASPVTKRSAYTQTYSTADKTHANPTATTVATTSATNSSPYGYSQSQADAIVTAVNALVADVADVKQLVNSVIDDLQALGLVG